MKRTPAVAAFVALAIATVALLLQAGHARLREAFSPAAARRCPVAQPLAFNDGPPRASQTVEAMIRPLATDVAGTLATATGDSARAYHYDRQYATWPQDVSRARTALLVGDPNKLIGRSHWSVSIDPAQVPPLALRYLANALRTALDGDGTHRTAYLGVSTAMRAVAGATYVLSFHYCMHAPGKSHGLCVRGSAVVDARAAGVAVRVLDLHPSGVVSQGDLAQLNGPRDWDMPWSRTQATGGPWPPAWRA